MAPHQRCDTYAVSQPATGNTSADERNPCSAGEPGEFPEAPDAPDADLEDEPEELLCPITRTMFRDPVVAVDSGHTYERSAILAHFRRSGPKDPLTRRTLNSTKVMTNWAMRNVVQAWLDGHPDATPDGWDGRELLEPTKKNGMTEYLCCACYVRYA